MFEEFKFPMVYFSEFGPFLSLSIDILRAMRNIIQHCKCWLGEGKKREKNSYKTCLGIFIDIFWWCSVVLTQCSGQWK